MRRDARIGVRRGGFTLLELLVVISLILILCSMLVVGVRAVKQAARGVQCMSNLRNITYGLEMFFQEQKRYPGGILAASLEGYLDNPEVFLCPAAGLSYDAFYVMPAKDDEPEAYVVSCPRHGRQAAVHTLGGAGGLVNRAEVCFDGYAVEEGETVTGTRGDFLFEDGTTASVDRDTVSLVVASLRPKGGGCRGILRVLEGKNKTAVNCVVSGTSVFDVVTPAGTAAVRRTETEAVVTASFDPANKNRLVLRFGKAPMAAIVPLLDALESAATYGEAAGIMSSITPAAVTRPNDVSFRDVLDYFTWQGKSPLNWDDFDRTTAGGQTFETMKLSDPLLGEHRTDVKVSRGFAVLSGVRRGKSSIGTGGSGAARAHSLESQRPPKAHGE
jgi:prepilin-type N-terminal cleavage/methylation domain-containing protein